MSHVVIIGAGPAGASLSCLLAQRGIEVTLLERRRDFSREFRGEVLMPSGVDALQQMGLGDALSSVANYTQQNIAIYMNARLLFDEAIEPESFRGHPPMAVSQAALLEALVSEANKHATFTFMRGVAVKELIFEADTVRGVRLHTDDGDQVLQADLVIGADGRNSMVRRQIGLTANELSPPMDIVWCKLPCPENWHGMRGYAGRGHLLVAYHTWDDTLQLGWVILKGTFGELKSRGIEEWVEQMARHVAPDLASHLREHSDSAEKPFLLSAVSDCVEHWSVPGALVIGDAAHTMSPVAGQGVNIALRDAIVAANHLVPVLTNAASDPQAITAALQAIETERMPEVQYIQNLQAKPPKLMLTRAWWGEPIRQLAATLLSKRTVRQRSAARIEPFLYGVTDVQLTV
jgi:2-polyprenyl-6-methoxyphenol hydroxylase-like FAD-dependent oxidoreductase